MNKILCFLLFSITPMISSASDACHMVGGSDIIVSQPVESGSSGFQDFSLLHTCNFDGKVVVERWLGDTPSHKAAKVVVAPIGTHSRVGELSINSPCPANGFFGTVEQGCYYEFNVESGKMFETPVTVEFKSLESDLAKSFKYQEKIRFKYIKHQ